MPAPSPLRVFLSYAHESSEHQARVRALAQRLQREGFEVTLDLDWPAPVEGWRVWIAREVTAADVVLVVVTAAYRAALHTPPERWPGPVLPPALCAEADLRPMLPVVFLADDAAYRPDFLSQQTCHSLQTDMDNALLLRTLASLAQPPAEQEPEPVARAGSPLPPLDRHLAGVQARLSLHRRAWRYFRSKLEGVGIALEEHPCDDTGAQLLTGPGIALTLTQHSEHAEVRMEILPGTAAIYAALLAAVSRARQPIECTYLVFTLKTEWQLITPASALMERLGSTDIELIGQQTLLLHGWRFIIPVLTAPPGIETGVKIVTRPAFPWPLNPLRLLLYLLEKHGALQR